MTIGDLINELHRMVDEETGIDLNTEVYIHTPSQEEPYVDIESDVNVGIAGVYRDGNALTLDMKL